MSDDWASPNKLFQRRHRFFGTRRGGNIGIGDACQSRDFRRYGAARMNKSIESLYHLATVHAGCRYLNQLIVLQRKSGCLGIENNHIIFY